MGERERETEWEREGEREVKREREREATKRLRSFFDTIDADERLIQDFNFLEVSVKIQIL